MTSSNPHAQLAWTFLQSLCREGDLDKGFELLNERFTYWSNVTRAEGDKAFLRQATEWRKGIVEITLDFVSCVVDGATVVIEAQGDGVTTSGVRYDSPYVYVFEAADGQLTSMREYGDTRLAAAAFSEIPSL